MCAARTVYVFARKLPSVTLQNNNNYIRGIRSEWFEISKLFSESGLRKNVLTESVLPSSLQPPFLTSQRTGVCCYQPCGREMAIHHGISKGLAQMLGK